MHLGGKKDENKPPPNYRASSHRTAVTLSEDSVSFLSVHDKKQDSKPEGGEPPGGGGGSASIVLDVRACVLGTLRAGHC